MTYTPAYTFRPVSRPVFRRFKRGRRPASELEQAPCARRPSPSTNSASSLRRLSRSDEPGRRKRRHQRLSSRRRHGACQGGNLRHNPPEQPAEDGDRDGDENKKRDKPAQVYLQGDRPPDAFHNPNVHSASYFLTSLRSANCFSTRRLFSAMLTLNEIPLEGSSWTMLH